jgi:hypothetical protein
MIAAGGYNHSQEIGGEQHNMTEQNWTEQEKQELGTQTETVYEKLPALKLVENEITELTIDFSQKFETYKTTDMKGQEVTKAIVPVFHKGERKNWWLNKKNPIYRELLTAAGTQTTISVKVCQIGSRKDTKYQLLK